MCERERERERGREGRERERESGGGREREIDCEVCVCTHARRSVHMCKRERGTVRCVCVRVQASACMSVHV